jgi:hypothetical protein
MPDQVKSKKNLLGRQVVKTKGNLKNSLGQNSASLKSRTVYDKNGEKIKTTTRTKSLVKRDDFGKKDKSFGKKTVVKDNLKSGRKVEKTNYTGRNGRRALQAKDVTRTIKNSNSNTSKPSDTTILKMTTKGKEAKNMSGNREVAVSKYKNDEQTNLERRNASNAVGQAKLYRGAVSQAKSQARQIKKNK